MANASYGRGLRLKRISALAPHYDRRWAHYIDASVQEATRRLELGPADRLLDVGCGTGVLLASLARRASGAQLTGVDPSMEMLNVARQRLDKRVSLVVAPAEKLPFADETFDVVVSTNVFHFLREPRGALAEMRRVLQPGGRLCITDWCDDYLACRVCDLYLRLFSSSHFRMYGTRSCQRLLNETDFHVHGVERYKITWLWGLMSATAVRPERQAEL